MEKAHILGVKVLVDREQTHRLSLAARETLATCCGECAVFLEAVRRDSDLASLLGIVRGLGAAPTHPDEVWGAADGNLLLGWWSVVGEFVDAPADSPLTTFGPDLKVWLGPLQALPDPAFAGKPRLAIEFEWTSPVISQIAREIGVHPDQLPTT